MSRRKAEGFCRDCSQPAEEGKKRCRKHLDILNNRMKQVQLDRELNGLCKSCGGELADDGFLNCESCRDRFNKNGRKNSTMAKLLRNERKSRGLCTRCGKKKEPHSRGVSFCNDCYEWNRNRMRKYRDISPFI